MCNGRTTQDRIVLNTWGELVATSPKAFQLRKLLSRHDHPAHCADYGCSGRLRGQRSKNEEPRRYAQVSHQSRPPTSDQSRSDTTDHARDQEIVLLACDWLDDRAHHLHCHWCRWRHQPRPRTMVPLSHTPQTDRITAVPTSAAGVLARRATPYSPLPARVAIPAQTFTTRPPWPRRRSPKEVARISRYSTLTYASISSQHRKGYVDKT